MADAIAIAQKSLLVFFKCCSSVSQGSLVLCIGVLLLSELVGVTATATSVSIAQQAETTSQDANRAAAEQLEREGRQLIDKGTAESIQEAIKKFETALQLWRVIGDRQWEAITLQWIGFAYSKLADYQKSLDYYNQALQLFRQEGDRSWEASTLESMGRTYSDLGDRQSSLDYFNHAVQIYHALGKQDQEADVFLNIGKVYFDLGEAKKAFDYYNQGLKIHRSLKNRVGIARALGYIGTAHGTLGESQQALDALKEALEIWRFEKNRYMETTILSVIATIYSATGQKQQALEAFNQVLAIFRAEGDTANEAFTLQNIGDFYSSLSDYALALDYYNQALVVHRAVKLPQEEAGTIYRIGSRYHTLGDYQQSLNYYNQALTIYRSVGDRDREAAMLNYIGEVYANQGEYQKSLDSHNQALAIQRTLGSRLEEASTFTNIAEIYRLLGDYSQSIDFYNQALEIQLTVGDLIAIAHTLEDLGQVYESLKDYQKTLEYYQQALSIWQATNRPIDQAGAIFNIGKAYQLLKEYQKALDFFNQALKIEREEKYLLAEVSTLARMSQVYDAMGDYQKAVDVLNKAVPISKTVGSRRMEAIVFRNFGQVYNSSGNYQKSLNLYNQELSLWREIGDPKNEADTLFNLAKVERNQGNLNQALTQIEAAINIVEDIRTRVTSQELRTSYFASVQKYYEFYIDLLMQLHKKDPSKGYEALALNASERARARSLLELLTEANADIRQGVEPKLLEQERTLQQKLDATEKRRLELVNGKYTDAQLKALEKETVVLLQEYRQVQEQIRRTSPRYASLTQPQPLTLAEIQQQVLDDDTMLLEYSLGEERSYLWAVTKSSITSYELPKRAEIEAAAKEFYRLLNNRTFRLGTRGGLGAVEASPDSSVGNDETATKLSQMLLAPVAAQLGNKRLLVVSDGALQYLPFAALPTPSTPLAPVIKGGIQGKTLTNSPLNKGGWGQIQGKTLTNSPLNKGGWGGKEGVSQDLVPLLVEHEIVNLPSASTLGVLRKELSDLRFAAALRYRKSAAKALAVLADPVFGTNDSRLQSSSGQVSGTPLDKSNVNSRALERAAITANVTFNRLPFTRKEAEQILALVPTVERMQAFDFAANRAIATNSQLQNYRIIHFATHGILNSTQPELSGVVLSLVDEKGTLQNGFLQLRDIFNLNLPAELVVLSACQTGLGEEVKGEGLVGLTRGFMYAGTPRVVVSLWSVDDEATSQLMVKFYKKMLQEGVKPAAALRAAQLEMWQQQKWQAPFYWAAFTLQGEWR